MILKIISIVLLIPSISFAAKCIEDEQWNQILNDGSLKKISNGNHFVMYDIKKCEAQVCDIFIYSKINKKEGDGKCFSLNRMEKGRYIFGGLQGDEIKLKIDGKIKEYSLKVEKKKR